jgi:hypothetical protein
VPEADDLLVLVVHRGESRQEAGGLAEGALTLIIGQKLKGLTLRLSNTLNRAEEILTISQELE